MHLLAKTNSGFRLALSNSNFYNKFPSSLPHRSMASVIQERLPPSSIPIFTTVSSYREWRRKAYEEKKSVGFVATMGALHEGHCSLVRKSLSENDLTVVSIFVNPAQFAPHEDLATYPRTLPHDLEVLSSLSHDVDSASSSSRKPSALFLPSVSEMYPSGISQNTSEQKGTFIEVKGYAHQMEGQSRPTFFRGVATVVTKLFNVIEPSRTYFGQKDIQQALLLRRLTKDLLLSHPSSDNLFIVPTARDTTTHLALSSRNAYLTQHQREKIAPVLYAALQTAKSSWEDSTHSFTKVECLTRARALISEKTKEFSTNEEVRLDYIEMNDADTFDVLGDEVHRAEWIKGERGEGRPVIVSGALWVGQTRLIDNIVIGDVKKLGFIA